MGLTEWLEWPVVWTGNGFGYQNEKDFIAPDSNVLAKAQRNINKVFEFKSVMKKLVGDLDEWTAHRNRLLKQAKYINAVGMPDFESLNRASKGRDQKQLSAILNLLEAEALVSNTLPNSPCRMLVKLQPDCRPALEAYFHDTSHNDQARALAAICLGTLAKETASKPLLVSKYTENAEWFSRCYKWGTERGLELEPAIAARILKRDDGAKLVTKLALFLSDAKRLTLSSDTLKQVLARGALEEEIALCCDELRKLEAILQQLVQYRHELPTDDPRRRQAKKVSLEQGRNRFSEAFADNIEMLVKYTPSSKLIATINNLIAGMLSTYPCNAKLLDHISSLMVDGLRLEDELRAPFFELVAKFAAEVWTKEDNGSIALVNRKYSVPILEGIMMLLRKTKNPVSVRTCLERGIVSHLTIGAIKSDADLRYILNTMDRMDITTAFDIGQLCSIVKRFGGVDEMQAEFEPVVREIEKAPFSMRRHYFDSMDFIGTNRMAKPSLSALARFLPYLIAATKDDESENCACATLMLCATSIARYAPKQEKEIFERITSIYQKTKPIRYDKIDAFTPAIMAGLSFMRAGVTVEDVTPSRKRGNDTSPAQLIEDLIEIFQSHRLDRYNHLTDSLEALRKRPVMARLIARQCRSHIKQMCRMVERLHLVQNWGEEATKPLEKLDRFKDALKGKTDSHVLKRLYTKGWGTFMKLVPDMVPNMQLYVIGKSITGGSQSPPSALLKLIETPDNLQRERDYLLSLSKRFPDKKELKSRLESLDSRLAKREDVVEYSAKLVRRHLVHLASEAEFEALEYSVRDVFFRQYKRIAPGVSSDTIIDNHVINALLLTQDIEENKRLLKRLIRAHAEGDLEWRERLPDNAKFLEHLRTKDIDVERWLSAYVKSYPFEGISGSHQLTFKLETDPLKILEMGNYFDTCLSLQGPFSYATVVNASDLNKRVAYAYDESGKVVARKLFGINTKDQLVGFNPYTSTSHAPTTRRLMNLMNEYCKSFAEFVGIPLDLEPDYDCHIDLLTSEFWHDDGYTEWNIDYTKVTEEDNNNDDDERQERKRSPHAEKGRKER